MDGYRAELLKRNVAAIKRRVEAQIERAKASVHAEYNTKFRFYWQFTEFVNSVIDQELKGESTAYPLALFQIDFL